MADSRTGPVPVQIGGKERNGEEEKIREEEIEAAEIPWQPSDRVRNELTGFLNDSSPFWWNAILHFFHPFCSLFRKSAVARQFFGELLR